MSDSSSVDSENSQNFLKIVTGKVLAKDEKQSSSNASVSKSFSTSFANYGKLAFCVCPVCRERQGLAINKDTVFKAEFQFRNLDPTEREFLKKLIKECRESNVCGYIVFNYSREDAYGVMEGDIKNINKIKDWLQMQTEYIPEPMRKNIYFSWFMIARQPMKLEFDEYLMPPESKGKSSDGESSD